MLVIVTGVALGLLWLRAPSVGSAALAANARGVAHLELFKDGGGYPLAVLDFEEAVRLAPDWLPARINLGIALMNNDPDNLDPAVEVFHEVLRRDPKNLHALYCLGIINMHRNNVAEAYEYLTLSDGSIRTTPIPGIIVAGRTLTAIPRPHQAMLRGGVALDPYLNAARYALAQHPHDRDPKRSQKLLDELKAFREASWYTEVGLKYTEMGKYADAISQGPPSAELRPTPAVRERQGVRGVACGGCRWATTADLGAGDAGKIRKSARNRFGATMILLDYDHDGRPDVFLAGAVIENGRLRDLLLHNEGELRFRDVTAAAGLATREGTLGCSAADFDNDGRTDLVVTGLNGVHLFRNSDGKQFEDVTQKAGLTEANGVCLGTAWFDLDQDADLDLVVCRYAPTAADALTATPAGELLVFLNAGERYPCRPADHRLADCRISEGRRRGSVQGEGPGHGRHNGR
jgi:tetratricopeptide (TPR) repeat protein